MFESAELGHRIEKSAYQQELATLRTSLLDIQFRLKQSAAFPVKVIISGPDGSGKGETINTLYEWMDPRDLSTLAFSMPSDEERERPDMWRFWRALPPKGRIGIFAGSWYSSPIQRRIETGLLEANVELKTHQINRFEEMLANEGALILKFWFHLSKDAQKRRLKALAADPRTSWKVSQWNWDRLKTYDKLQQAAGHVLSLTNTPWAPWNIIEAEDDRYRSLATARILLDAITTRMAETTRSVSPVIKAHKPQLDRRDVISELKLDRKPMGESAYEIELARWQGRLAELSRDPRMRQCALICAFEGVDAAGKGGAIRRVTAALDARQFQIIPVAAPSDEERAQPYLWRFWRHVPRLGRITIFDRTWYGRVLVERVEKFCSEEDWRRAYSEINDFEQQLIDGGTVLVKFWMQTSREEQLRRFKEREKVAFKRFKITEEDWRNREKWDAYHDAVCDMVDQTSTAYAPWTLVEANDKRYARIKVLKTICNRLESAMLQRAKNSPTGRKGKA
jgi:polyphosphate:AMP phosphotransferase